MIILPVDESYAFDYLAILYVKAKKGMDVQEEADRVEQCLKRQIENIGDILESKEFDNMVKVNEKTFAAIDAAHENKISASEVQKVNHERFLAKRALQTKFWPSEPMLERKTLDAK